MGSAREAARRCEFDPAFQWLTGLEEVNYHTLGDFRVAQQQELDELFPQVLAAQSQEGRIPREHKCSPATTLPFTIAEGCTCVCIPWALRPSLA